MRKTKIICTLGPATGHTDVLRQLIEQGTDMFRLNMSHADHRSAREVVPRIRQLAEEARRPVAILLDTQGPAIRTGDLKINLDLKADDILELTVGDAESEEPYSVHVNYDGLVDDVAVGDTVLVDNGMIRLVVLEKRGKRIRCKVITPGTLGSRRHINLPGVRVNLPPLTQKDLGDIALGVEMKVDFIAVTDAIMVARGDLGIEWPIEELPIIQRKIVKLCARLGKPVVVATHMLESMIHNPLPTRAEITDVANAVFEQADAIMLSGETSVGAYPVECVRILNRVAVRIERSGGAGYAKAAVLEDVRQKTVASAVVLANSLPRARIIVFTRHGTMARNTSNLRPEHATIFAFTPSEEVRRQLALCWGTYPVRIKFTDDPNATIEAAERYLRDAGLTLPGDNLVIISDLRAGETLVDTVQLRTAR